MSRYWLESMSKGAWLCLSICIFAVILFGFSDLSVGTENSVLLLLALLPYLARVEMG